MLKAVLVFLRAMLIPRLHLAVENLALRQQLAVFKQSGKPPKLRPRDRVFWVWLSRLWPCWRSALAIVQPETVVKWLCLAKISSLFHGKDLWPLRQGSLSN